MAGALRSVRYQRRGEEVARAGPPDETRPSEPKLNQGDSSCLGPSDPQPIGLQPEESHELARRGMAGRARKYWYSECHCQTLSHNGVTSSPARKAVLYSLPYIVCSSALKYVEAA